MQSSQPSEITSISQIPEKSYKSTAIACYLGNFVQAIVINLTPILFIPLRELYNLSYSQLGFLVLINFVTQVVVDVALSGMPDKYGFRIFAILGQSMAIAGFIIFALTPFLFQNIYLGVVISTIIFSGGGGLMEMLLSPIVDSIPTDVKSTAMSVLHSFYAWGQLSVILITTLLIYLFGSSFWPLIVTFWMIVPIINLILFIKVPLTSAIPDSKRTKMIDYIKAPFFIIAFCAILLGGASEVSMAQWASAFMEKGLGLPKLSGDLFGVAMFALMLGVGRFIFGKFGAKINLNQVMIKGSLVAIFCYLIIALSPYFGLSLFFCGVCGLAVSLLWPGTLVLVSERFPFAGASIFALLAAGGDIGASVGPWVISLTADYAAQIPFLQGLLESTGLSIEQFSLRAGILVGVIFPILCLCCHIWLSKHKENNINLPAY